jgi:hypothetical protein
MGRQRQTEEERIQHVNDELVEKVMGWRASGARYYKASRGWVSKRRFNPMRDLSAVMSLIHHARHRNPGMTGELLFRVDGTGTMAFVAIVRLDGTQHVCISHRPWASMALSEALARAYGVVMEGCAR